MLNCKWAHALTKYDCRPIDGLHGEPGLEISTPFSLPGGAPVTLYLLKQGNNILISDNGDTIFGLGGTGFNIYNAHRLTAVRRIAEEFDVTLTDECDLRTLTTETSASLAFARCTAALLAICRWTENSMRRQPQKIDLLAEVEPYLIARAPNEKLIRNFKIEGASTSVHVFDYRQGGDIIDVIPPTAVATGRTMRKVGDVMNGRYALDDNVSPLVIVDDRFDPVRAFPEMGIIASLCRVQPVSALMAVKH